MANLSTTFPAPLPPSPISQLIVQGSACEREGRIQEAFNIYSEAIKLDSKDARPLLSRASLVSNYPALNQNNVGLNDAVAALVLLPASPLPLLIRCKIFSNQREPWSVMTESSIGLTVSPNNRELLLYQAKSYLEFPEYMGLRSRFEYASEVLTKLLNQAPSNRAECLLLRAEAYFGLKKYDQAFKDLLEVEISPLKNQASSLLDRVIPHILDKAERLQKAGKLLDAHLEVLGVLSCQPFNERALALFESIGEQLSFGPIIPQMASRRLPESATSVFDPGLV